jgi:hypothetical protein
MAPLVRDKPNNFLTNQVVSDVKTFINILLSAVIQFYEPVIKPSEMNMMKEDIVESVTSLILSKDVYKIMFSFFRVEYQKTEGNLRERFKEFRHLTPAECRVNEYFRMDATSPILKIYQDIVTKDMFTLFSEPMSINFEMPSRFSNTENHKSPSEAHSWAEEQPSIMKDPSGQHSLDDSIQMKFIEKEEFKHQPAKKKLRSRSFDLKDKNHVPLDHKKLPPIWEIEKRLQKKPFHSAIVKLRELDTREGPMMKLRLLETVNQMIKEEIWQFWEGLPINESHLIITQDIKIPLYIYIVLKSKIVNLPAQIRFIQEFTTNYVHENNLGSNLALYESAMTIIADKERDTLLNVISQQEILEEKARFNESFATSVFIDDIDPFVEFTPHQTALIQ